MSLHVFTYSTSEEKARYLFESAEIHGLSIQNLAKTKEWTCLRDKLIAMLNELKTLPDNDIVCFVDAYDLLVNADASKIIETFKSTNCKVLFGAETILFPDTFKDKEYPQSPTLFRYLNAGCYIGYVSAIRNILDNENIQENDQDYLNHYYVDHGKDQEITLDHHVKLVLNMNTIPWGRVYIENGYVHFPPMDTTPCFIHFNGMSYLDRNKDLKNNMFDYNGIYDRTFINICKSKRLTQEHDVLCMLTGTGHSYKE
jgi:hypothetical protein